MVEHSYTLRRLCKDDYENGFLECLEQLTEVGKIPFGQFKERLDYIDGRPEQYHVVVLVQAGTQTVVGAGTLFIEHKFIHRCGSVGHIEDIVVDKAVRGKGLGKLIVDSLAQEARKAGCYKVLLNCSEDKTDFYQRCGFVQKGSQMAIYFDSDSRHPQ